MKAKIISLMNQKGGAGKTTITMQLAAALGHLKKYRVLVVDADPQSSAMQWVSFADSDQLFPATVINLSAAGKKFYQEVKKFLTDYNIIIIDCPPAIGSEVPQTASIISDLALIPVVPSPTDLWSTVGIKKLLDRAEPVNPDLQKFIIMNMVQTQHSIGKEVTDALVDIDIPLMKSRIGLRTAFRKSAAYGNSVFDLGTDAAKAQEDIKKLCDEVNKILF